MGRAIRTGFSLRGEPASIGFMESQLDWHNARALLEWQVDLGATEAIQEQPVDRFALDPAPVKAPKIMPNVAKPPAAPPVPAVDAVAVAHGLAEQSQTLEDLAAALGGFELCDLRKGARNLVFGEGQTGCDVAHRNTKSYGGFFHLEPSGMKDRHIFIMDGYGGQTLTIDFDSGRIVTTLAVHRDFNWMKIAHSVIKKGK